MAHTPGPWNTEYDINHEKGAETIILNKEGYRIADCCCDDAMEIKTAIDNARLIVAAPDLLEACKAWMRDRSTCPTSNGKDLESWELMRKAIARAEGKE